MLSGKKGVEEKKKTKQKLGQSPDLADTGNLTFAVIKGADVGRIEPRTVSTGLDLDDEEEC